jgi:hypothetical protein
VKKGRHAAALLVLLGVVGCISIPVAANVVVQPGRLVTAEASTFSFLWLSPLPVETASQLVDKLVQQCGGADLTGVTVATQTAWVFIGQQEKMIASGYCVEPD